MTILTDVALRDRREFLNIDEQELTDLVEAWKFIEGEFPAIVDRFYERMGVLTKVERVAHMINNNDRLKRKQFNHWSTLFRGSLSSAYVDQVRRSGIAHHEVGISLTDLVDGYAFIFDAIIKVLQEKLADDPARALQYTRSIQKLVAIDVGAALCVYDAVLVG